MQNPTLHEEKSGMEEIFKVDLAEIEWNLSFPCPGCGEAILPEDKSGRCYSLLEIRVEETVIKEAVIRCSRCRSRIRLGGFEMLSTFAPIPRSLSFSISSVD